jgi:hypothetical protein
VTRGPATSEPFSRRLRSRRPLDRSQTVFEPASSRWRACPFQGRGRRRASASRLLNGTGFGSGTIPVPLQGLQVSGGSIGSPNTAGRITTRYPRPSQFWHFISVSRISHHGCTRGVSTAKNNRQRTGQNHGPARRQRCRGRLAFFGEDHHVRHPKNMTPRQS